MNFKWLTYVFVDSYPRNELERIVVVVVFRRYCIIVIIIDDRKKRRRIVRIMCVVIRIILTRIILLLCRYNIVDRRWRKYRIIFIKCYKSVFNNEIGTCETVQYDNNSGRAPLYIGTIIWILVPATYIGRSTGGDGQDCGRYILLYIYTQFIYGPKGTCSREIIDKVLNIFM